jgi:hypothetical protein
MTRKQRLKVYGWTGFVYGIDGNRHNRQSRCIVAAHSMEEAAEVCGYRSKGRMFNITETGNVEEINTAMRDPLVQFHRGLDDHYKPFVKSPAPTRTFPRPAKRS